MNYHIPPKTDGRHCDAHLFPEPSWLHLPKTREFLGLGWHRHLPAEAGVLFTSLVILECAGCTTAKEQSHWLKVWHEQVRYARPTTPEQACAKEDVERRFNQEYGKPWSDTLTGLLTLLEDLGLVVRDKDEAGEEHLRIPDALPLPEDRLNLSKAEKAMLEAIRERNYTGKRGRTIEEAKRVLGQ